MMRALVLLAAAMAGLTVTVQAAGPVQPGVADLVISGPEADTKMRLGLEGDGDAALAIAISFLATDTTHQLGFYWMTIAAENGNADAQFNLAFLMKGTPRDDWDKARWKYWAKRAAASGDPEIARQVKELMEE